MLKLCSTTILFILYNNSDRLHLLNSIFANITWLFIRTTPDLDWNTNKVKFFLKTLKHKVMHKNPWTYRVREKAGEGDWFKFDVFINLFPMMFLCVLKSKRLQFPIYFPTLPDTNWMEKMKNKNSKSFAIQKQKETHNSDEIYVPAAKACSLRETFEPVLVDKIG